jgi:uncharacterized membrane protein
MKNTKQQIEFKILEFGILIKAINGIFEISAALLIALVHSSFIYSIVKTVFSHEIAHDPNDLIANSLLNFTQSLSFGTKEFIALYLAIHGIVNLYIFFIVWKQKFRQFPAVIIILLLLIIYQIFRFAHNHSILLFFLTLIDMIIVYLIADYMKEKAQHHI